MLKLMRKIMRNRDAMTFVEYGLLIGFLALSIVFGMKSFTNQLYRLWQIVEVHSNNATSRH